MSRISRRLLGSVAALIVLVVLVVSLVSGYALRRELLLSLEADMVRQGKQLAVILTHAANNRSLLATESSALERLIREAGAASEVRFTVIDREGAVIADSDEDPRYMGDHSGFPEVVVALAGGEGRSRRFSAARAADTIYVAVPVPASSGPWSEGAVRVSAASARIDLLLEHVWWLPLALGAIALVPSLAAAYLVSRSLTRPIERLRAMAVGVSKGDLSHRVATSRRTDELGELARAINQMAHNLEHQVHELRTERARMADVLTSMDDGVLVMDADGIVAGANPAAAVMLRSTVDDLEGQPIVHTARAFPAQPLVDEAIGSGRPFTRSVAMPGDRTFEVQVAPLTGEGLGGPTVVMVLHDATERTRVERIRKDFVANVSHELKTPLAGLSLLAETLQRAVHDDPESAEGFAARLTDEIDRLTDLVDDLLALSVLDEGRTFESIPSGTTDLSEIVRDVVRDHEALAATRGVALALETGEATAVTGDPVALATLVRNLVDNALRYTEPGGHVEVSVQRDGGDVRLRVKDDGIGIPRDDRDRIFERFYRVDKARSRETGGTGLGLSIVRNIAVVHGGTVTVESAVGVGSTFTVRLPSALSADAHLDD